MACEASVADSQLLHQPAKTMIAFIKLPRESYERMWIKARLKSIDEMKVRKYQMKNPTSVWQNRVNESASDHVRGSCNCAFCHGI